MNDAQKPVLVWFREDLRIADNPALFKAAETGAPMVAVFILDEESTGVRPFGSAQKWMLHHALTGLAKSLQDLGGSLLVRRGASEPILRDIIAETGADRIFWNRRYGPGEIAVDAKLKAEFGDSGVAAHSFLGALLHEPSRVKTGNGDPFRVYSPFWRALERMGEPRLPLPVPEEIAFLDNRPKGMEIVELGLLPVKPDWAKGLRDTWPNGEAGAHEMLAKFLDHGIHGYADGRDMPAAENVSRLSPYLRFGMISPYQIWHAAKAAEANARDREKFLKEVGWREFAYHLLFNFPDIGWRNFSERFDVFPWKEQSPDLKAWQRGMTGYPIVDAGMRELWHTGYMHNRVRMVAASLLVKHLLIHWKAGEEWFWDTLVDGDPANNPASWQWVAGSGADAAPYFRVFNPILQGRKFDPDGEYTRKWVPEIAALPDKYLHCPWEAPAETLLNCGIRLGKSYPMPIIDHDKARIRALDAFETLKKAI
ncbi:MAG: deoxyribodipyrimidine photo-lyase [Nitratireductor sp.]|nr:deoxyribodipyrimidine photo-lyase [Nitratireductor sp.]